MIGEIDMDTVTIILTAPEAEMFTLWRKHQDDFMVLLSAGIFDLKNGSITIHKDSGGTVRKIETNQISFSATHN